MMGRNGKVYESDLVSAAGGRPDEEWLSRESGRGGSGMKVVRD